MRTSRRLAEVQASLTLEIDAKAKQYRAAGKDVIGLAAGEPDFGPPVAAETAAVTSVQEHLGRYTAVAGYPLLRREAARAISELNGWDYGQDQIVVSSGAKQSLFNALYVLADPGDEVLILAPYWTSYPEMCRALALKPVIVPCLDDLSVDVKALRGAITERTRAIVVNTPSNPAGRVMSRSELESLAEVLRPHDIWILSDDIYARLVFNGQEFVNLPMVAPDLRDRSLIIYGMSKSYCMTGWRIGFVAGVPEVIRQIATIQSHSTSCANTIAQIAAAAALGEEDSAHLETMIEAFERRSRFVVDFLSEIDGITCPQPEGAFYAFPKVSHFFGTRLGERPIRSALDLAAALLDEALVAVVPGEAFGAPDRMRISYATSMVELERARERMQSFFARLHR